VSKIFIIIGAAGMAPVMKLYCQPLGFRLTPKCYFLALVGRDELMAKSASSRINQWRQVVLPGSMGNMLRLGDSASLHAQFWFGQMPLRPTAAWSLVAALLASGLLEQPASLNWQTLVLLLLLVDPLWGSIWRLAGGRRELLPLASLAPTRPFWLPYLQAGSPAQRLLGWDRHAVLPLLVRVAAPSLLLAGGVALALGLPALLFTALVILISVLGWTSRRALQMPPVLLQSLVTIGLPWWLTRLQLADSGAEQGWFTPVTGLVVLCTLHHWGEGRTRLNPSDWLGWGLLALAEVWIAMLLVFLGAPLWLLGLVICWLPAWVLIYQCQSVEQANIWWLLALLIGAWAIGSA
jgi:hypothetical protein